MLLVQKKFYGREVILADRDMVEQNSGLSDHSMHISSWKLVMSREFHTFAALIK